MKFHLGYILGLFSIALAAGAAYISVTGWGKLFAGEALVVMIIMGIIEAAKVVTTIYLHKYGKKTKFMLKAYLVIGVIATMILTSVGIYGFLTSAYQETANKMELQSGEKSILQNKKDIFDTRISDNKEIISNKQNRKDQLGNLRLTQEARLDSLIANNHWTNVKRTRQDIENATMEIQKLTVDIDTLNAENAALSDSSSAYQIKIVEIDAHSDIAGEIGPLKYISTLTGRSMDSIINYLVLIIIFIFDPMAISLVLATNRVFDLNAKNKGGEEPEPDYTPINPTPTTPNTITPTEDQSIGDDEVVVNEPEEEDLIENFATATTINLVEEDVEVDSDELGVQIDLVEDLSPEEQLEENKDIIEEISGRPEIPAPNTTPESKDGKLKLEDIKEVKEKRGFSTEIPAPNVDVTKVGTNKEIRNNDGNTFWFNRPKNGLR